ncbi:cell envelope integrity protein TolA [Luteimonas sp. 3794]|uniref:cell envelope integrity protein TolA n=1 Tax=Luteimonas sp. 3794 TaxID=2817730 RepID=UPI002855298D|nr:cell envelope integrity protein TolA [Luteimonas sp. 3794]MDR6991675.1 membrane protein involved in colicin uptake [Luteimonas sp. 3794]
MSLRIAAVAAIAIACGVSSLAGSVEARTGEDHVTREARYAKALRHAIAQHWTPPAIDRGATCRVRVRQLPGGEVLNAEPMSDCSFDAAAQASLVRAVYRAAPLPYAGFEPVFARDLTITFTMPTP